jgi:3-methyladenine DNA glycosylase AlkD
MSAPYVQSKPTPAEVAAAILAALEQAARPAAAEQGRKFFKEPVHLMGVNAATMHRLARETYAAVKPHWQVPDAVDLCHVLLPDPRLEPKAVALLVLGRYGNSFDKGLLPVAEKWIEDGYCASWGLIDTLCPNVVGPLLTRYPGLTARTRRWTRSPNRWLRRAAAVSLVVPARKGQLLDQAYDMARRLQGDQDDLVQKATGWLLREAGRTDPDRLATFLREEGFRFARTSVRYAIERCPEDVRRGLLETTRAPPKTI